MFIGNGIKNEKMVVLDHVRRNDKYEKDSIKNGVINGSTLRLGLQDKEQHLIEEKKQSLRKQAQNIIENVGRNQKKRFDSLEKMEYYCKTLEKECQEDRKELSNLRNARKALMEEYGINADSEEEKELKDVERFLATQKGGDDLEEKMTAGFTEYQKRAFEIDKMSKVYSDGLKSKENERHSYQNEIIAFKINAVKDRSMIDGRKEAEELLEKGTKDIINQIVKEAIEEKQEENIEEKKEDKVEDKKEQEEKKLDDRVETQEFSMEEAILINQIASDATSQKLLKIVHDSNLYHEDIKGIVVDDQI